MNDTWFNTDERRTKLEAEATRWIGTPWAANSATCGGGVSCHNLPRSICVGVGAVPADYPVLEGNPIAAMHTNANFFEPFLDSRPELRCLAAGEARLPGDVLGFRFGPRTGDRTQWRVNHLGVLLADERFIHVLAHKRTCADPLMDPTWRQRLLRIWRVRA